MSTKSEFWLNTVKNSEKQPKTAKIGQKSRLSLVHIFARGQKVLGFWKIRAFLNRGMSSVQEQQEFLKFDDSSKTYDPLEGKTVKKATFKLSRSHIYIYIYI